MADYSYLQESSGDKFRFLKFAAAAGAGALLLGAKTFNRGVGDKAAASNASESGRVYEVKKGDTLTSIAEKHGSSILILKTVNDLKNDDIFPEQKLWVPRTYVIEKGDTLYQISKKFQLTVDDILKVNSIQDPNRINPGDILLLP